MSDNSAIEWTEASWNPVTGCTRVSEGCRHCYIEPMDLRWAVDLVRNCQGDGIPMFVKQLGSRWGSGHHEISLFPPALRFREYPDARGAVPA